MSPSIPVVSLAFTMILLGSADSLRAQSGQDQIEIENGLVIAQQFCASCHIISEAQRGPVPDGVPSFQSLSSLPDMNEKGLKARIIVPPHPAMPESPLSNDQTKAVAAYILSLRR